MKLRRSRLSTDQTQRLLEHFVAGTPARTAAELVGVNRNTATYFYHRLRQVVAARLAFGAPLSGEKEVEVSESYFGAARKGKRGKGGAGKVAVFGLLERGGKVYTVIVPDTERDTLSPILRAKVGPDAIVYTDTLDVGDLLDALGHRHQRVDHSERFVRGGAHIGGIENFWHQAKRNLGRYNGIPRHHFHLFLKECEWRFNYGSPRQLLDSLEGWIREES